MWKYANYTRKMFLLIKEIHLIRFLITIAYIYCKNLLNKLHYFK